METKPNHPSPLTPKQEAFAQAYVETSNASEAYRRCCNVRPTTKPESVWQSASRLLADIKVASRVAQLQAHHQQRHDITVDDLTEQYNANRELALETSQPGAANGSTSGIARLHGLDKSTNIQVTASTQAKVVLGDIELARRMAYLLECGIDV
jgi:phage terminase small subunit